MILKTLVLKKKKKKQLFKNKININNEIETFNIYIYSKTRPIDFLIIISGILQSS